MTVTANYQELYKSQLAVNADIKTKHANLVLENKKLKERIFALETEVAHTESYMQEVSGYDA